MIKQLLVFGVGFMVAGCQCYNNDGSAVGKNKCIEKVESDVVYVEGADKVEVLSKHYTNAVYMGTQYRLCRGLTAQCPDKCGDSGEFAIFHIEDYRSYERIGEYADDKQSSFLVQVSDFDKKLLNTKKAAIIAQLKDGDKVELDWQQLYVTKENSSYPMRPIKRLSKR
ncbi:MAG: hypothetical protein ACRC37_08500 [Lentisphaeria bacterium]